MSTCFQSTAMLRAPIPATKRVTSIKNRVRVSPRGLTVCVRAKVDSESELPPGACKGCGNLEGPKGGCNGKGRIPGGMSAIMAATNGGQVPDWWPIKIYRPCPLFLEAGNAYETAGQSVDDIFFGGGSTTRDFLEGKDQ